MTAALPYGAAEIVAARQAGNRPADVVLVSIIGPLREINPVVIAKPNRAIDWRFLVDLDVLLVADSTTDGAAVRRTVSDLAAVKPSWLGLWLADVQDGAEVRKNRKPWPFLVADRLEFAGLGNAQGREACLKLIGANVKTRAMDALSCFDGPMIEAGTRGLKSLFAAARRTA